MDSPLRKLRHDLRGRANTLMLCAAVLPMADTDKDRLEFIEQIMVTADKLVSTLDELEALPEHVEEDGATPS